MVCLALGGCLLSVGGAGAAEVGQQAAPNQEQIEYTKNAPRVVNDVLAVKSIVYRDVTVDSGSGLDGYYKGALGNYRTNPSPDYKREADYWCVDLPTDMPGGSRVVGVKVIVDNGGPP